MKVHALWFIAGALFGAAFALILGLPYVSDLAQTAVRHRLKAAATPRPSPQPWPKGFDRMVSGKSVTVGASEMVLLQGRNGQAVLKFEASTPSGATYRWRSFTRSGGTAAAGSGSIERKVGELTQNLVAGPVSVDWLGEGTKGTILYHQGATLAEVRPAAEFETLDLCRRHTAASPVSVYAEPASVFKSARCVS